MNKKITFIASIIGFFVGAFFVLSNSADVTANVIGASGESAGLTAVLGIVLLVASAGVFILMISLDEEVLKTGNQYAKHKQTDQHYASDDLQKPAYEKSEEKKQ